MAAQPVRLLKTLIPCLTFADSIPSVSSSATSMQSPPSRVSTPPTELSQRSESPEFVLPPETEETRLRRAQSDRASSEIGQLLLQGWAMLAEECPNSGCYGVPLVRAPKAGGAVDDKKVRRLLYNLFGSQHAQKCVICGNTFVSQIDSQGREGYAVVDGPAMTQTQTSEVRPPITTIFVSIPEETLVPVPAPTVCSNSSTLAFLLTPSSLFPRHPQSLSSKNPMSRYRTRYVH